MKHYVMLLADGETYTELNGCYILVLDVADDDPEMFELDELVKNHGVENVAASFGHGINPVNDEHEIEIVIWDQRIKVR